MEELIVNEFSNNTLDLTLIEEYILEIIKKNDILIGEIVRTNIILKWCFGILVISLVLLIVIFLSIYLSKLK